MASAKTMGFKELALSVSAVANVAMGGYLLLVAGSAQVNNKVNFPSTGSGVQLTVDGVTRYRQVKGTCSATGGLTSYTTCYVPPLFTSTGTLLEFSLECGNNVVAQSGDVSFKKTLTSASGAPLTNGNNLSLGSGANLHSQLAVPVSWNPADYLTFSTLVAPTGTLNTTRYNCSIWATVSDKYGT